LQTLSVNVIIELPDVVVEISGLSVFAFGEKETIEDDAVHTPPVTKDCVPETCMDKSHKKVSSKITGYGGNVI
jgi:hypothetical protein